MLDPDTIVAVSTPPGRGGIGIVRLSGPRAVEISSPLLRLNHPLTPNRARFGHLLDLSDPANLVDKSVIPTAVEGPPHLSLPPSNLEPRTSNLIETSALTGLGIPALRAAIVAAVAGPGAGPRESALLTNLRQHQAVQESLRALAAALAAVAARIPHEMLLVDLYAALRPLDSLTGATTTDDLLRLIFSTFCIGK
jgi:tRNA modification GTPase